VGTANPAARTAGRRPFVAWVMTTLLLAVAGVAALALVGSLEFGSLSAALRFLRGERLLADASSKDVGTIPAGETREIEFHLTNVTDHPLTVVGFKSSCGCASATRLPMTIAPGATAPLAVSVRASARLASISTSVRLYTDDPGVRDPILYLTGQIQR
jgi:hypothetical protein